MIEKILSNWKAGLTVSLVSIPLSLALAIASGATPTQGIITAFWAGFLGALFGGTNFNIIGPTGALSGILVSCAISSGCEVLPIIAILSGLLIFICYLLHLDKYIIFIPRSVIYGFTLGIAFILAIGQIDNILGLENMRKTESLVENTNISLSHIDETKWDIVIIFLISTIFIFIWNKKFPKVPGAIIITVVSIAIVLLANKLNLPLHLSTVGDKFPDISPKIFENIFTKLSWSTFLQKEIWISSITVAIISILETLLSGQIADQMTGTKFNRSKEVLGLAIANLGSGLMGGIPATAALARTALNIKSGANHRIAGIISAIFIAIISLFLLVFFKMLPMVIIASILVIVAIGMIETKHFIHLINNEIIAFILSLLTAILVVIEDPMMGILVGAIIALLIFVNKVSYGQTEILIWDKGKMIEAMLKNEFIKKKVVGADIIVYKISGTLTYVNMPSHLEAIQKIKDNKYVIISLRHAFYADIDGIDYLEEIIEILKKNNGSILLSGINKEIEKLICKADFYKAKLIEKKIYTRTSDAINDIVNPNSTKLVKKLS